MKRKIILNLAISLDGYIARKNGEVSWIDGDGSEPNAALNDEWFSKFLESISSIIMGRSSWEVTKKFGDPAKQFKNKKIYVITSKKLHITNKDSIKDSGSIDEVVKNAKGNIWLFGGGNLVKQFLEKNLIDEIIIGLIPVLLGSGIRLFFENTKAESKWKLENSHTYNGIVILKYIKKLL